MVSLIAISAGVTYALTQTIIAQPSSKLGESGAFMMGHITAVVRDDNGVIKAYRQADNAIVNRGLESLADQLFLDCLKTLAGVPCVAASTNNHTNTTGHAFGYMNIGNHSAIDTPLTGTNTGLGCALTRAGSGCSPGGGVNKAGCIGSFDRVWNTRAALTPGGASQINMTVIATFLGTNCASRNIQEAGLWNNATTAADASNPFGQMLARNNFGAVTLTNTDSLELTWKFTFTDT